MKEIPIIFSAPMVQALLAGTKTMTRRLSWRDAKFGLQDYSSEQLEEMDAKGWNAVGEGNEGLWRVYKPTAWQRVKPGDRLWVRENWRVNSWSEDGDLWVKYPADNAVHHIDHGDPDQMDDLCEKVCAELEAKRVRPDKDGFYPSTEKLRTRPSIHMPRWASRLTLIVQETKIELLKEISEDDAFAEGIETDAWDMAPVARNYGEDDAWFVGWPMGVDAPSVSVDCREVCRRSFESLWCSLHGPESWDSNPEVVVPTFKVQRFNIDALPKEIAA